MKKGLLKKICSGLVISAMSISLIGCGGSSEEKDKLDVIKDNGKVVVGLSADYAPYEFHAMIDGKDEIVGFDVELAKEIAKDLGVELEFKEMEFESLLAAWKKQIDFSDIYYESRHGVLVKAEDVDKYNTVDDLSGKNIGAQLGSTQQEIAETEVEAGNLQLLANVNNLILELKTGKVDALITEEPVAKMALENNPELALSAISFDAEGGGNAVGIAKGSPKLVEAVNKTIKRLQESWELDQFIIDAYNLAA